VNAVVLDAGALIALERRDRRALALVRELLAHHMSAHVPAGVLAQVWRGSARQHAVTRLLKAEAVRVHALSESVAYRIGLLLAAAHATDVVDAHVALLGRALHAKVITSDSADLQRLDDKLDIVPI
jgi:predicted nucleic acid-binding protein